MVNIFFETDAIADLMFRMKDIPTQELYCFNWPFPLDEPIVICTKKYALSAVLTEYSGGYFVYVDLYEGGKHYYGFMNNYNKEKGEREIIHNHRFDGKPKIFERDSIVLFFHYAMNFINKYELPQPKKNIFSSTLNYMKKNRVKGNSYHLIKLESSSNRYIPIKKEYVNKTNIKQRYHMRRGHYRMLKSGKKIWVKSCYAGNKELGIVHKDYAA